MTGSPPPTRRIGPACPLGQSLKQGPNQGVNRGVKQGQKQGKEQTPADARHRAPARDIPVPYPGLHSGCRPPAGHPPDSSPAFPPVKPPVSPPGLPPDRAPGPGNRPRHARFSAGRTGPRPAAPSDSSRDSKSTRPREAFLKPFLVWNFVTVQQYRCERDSAHAGKYST